MSDRIEILAKAMGEDPNLFGPLSGSPIFDPFIDANHDYAVLEWMRGQGTKYHFIFKFSAWEYQIGEYARAAIKVIE